MQFRFVAMVSLAALFGARAPQAMAQSAVPAAQTATPPDGHTITLPAGTAIPLTLINPIRSRSSKPGDAVRATVAFPVTAGTQLAIPPNSYVEGVIKQVVLRTKGTGQPSVQIHFTRLLFANGYSAALDGDNTQAALALPSSGSPETAGTPKTTSAGGPLSGGFNFAAQQNPQPPPLPTVGPSPAVVTGAVLGGGIAITALSIMLMHRRATHIDAVLFDSGWQFQMVLNSPLVIGADQTAPAAQ